MLITPKNAIAIVLAQKTKDASFCPYETVLQKFLFWLAIGSLVIGAVFAMATYIWSRKLIVLIALIAVLVSMLFALAYQVALALPTFIKLRNIEKEISTPLLQSFDPDMDLINELAQTYEPHHLSYANTIYALMAKQLRERIAILVGALDKVGIIPIAITGYISFAKAQQEKLFQFGGIEWVLVSFIFLYLIAIRMTATAQWMEQISEIYKQAVSLKTHEKR